MKSFFTAFVLCSSLALSAWSQVQPSQPLSELQQFLGLTDSQLSAILQNNKNYNTFAFQQQQTIQHAQSQIAAEIAKDPLDPTTIGNLYAGIETTCRALRDKAASSQQLNISVLTDPQKVNLNVLNDALKLAPTISEAQSGNLLESAGIPRFFLNSVSGCGSNVISAIRIKPFSQVQQFLGLSDDQVAAILQNQNDYNNFVSQQRQEISQDQSQLFLQTAEDQTTNARC